MLKENSWGRIQLSIGWVDPERGRFGEIERISRHRTYKNINKSFNHFGMKL